MSWTHHEKKAVSSQISDALVTQLPSSLRIKHYLCKSTLYGDWSCITFNSDTKKPICKFCADAGLVAVFLLNEVLKYNSDFDYHIERPWTTTLIKDFDGDVEIKVVHTEGIYEEDSEYWKRATNGKTTV